MKKRGFTLAEVLITLGIIGVVAALTAPQLVMSSKNEATCSKLATTVSNLENAFHNAIIQEEVTGLKDTEFYNKGTIDVKAGYLGKYIHLAGTEGNKMITKSGVKFTFATKNDAEKSEADTYGKGGQLRQKVAEIEIRTSPSQADKAGRNLFKFYVGNDGSLYPLGGNDTSVYDGSGKYTTAGGTGTYECSSSKVTLYCTGRIVEDGYKMNY